MGVDMALSLRDEVASIVSGSARPGNFPFPDDDDLDTADRVLDMLQEKAERVWDCPDGDACWGVPPDCPHNGRWLLQFVESDWEGR
jgi:hypothetical protein